jgi:hypothetical protein
MSWTTDETKARWFAERKTWFKTPPTGYVMTATIAPKHVLGIFHERNESEIVVNPAGLTRYQWTEILSKREAA